MSDKTNADLAAVLEAITRPIEHARGIPAAWYTDPEIFAQEQDRIFRRGWMAVCFSHEVSDPGDAFPETVCGARIVVVRGMDGVVRAFHNVCRHRASLVVLAPTKKLHSLRCNYHCWTYGLDGKLKNAPFFDGCPVSNGGENEVSLAPVRCEEREGIVFVNLDGTAGSIDVHLEPVVTRWQQYDRSKLDRFTTLEKTIPANWKVVMEGLLEVYHEEFIHEDLTYRLTEDGEKDFEDIWSGELMGFRSPMPTAAAEGSGPALPRLPGMPAAGKALSEIFLLFPNVSFNILDNHLVTTIWTYASVKETRWKSTWYFAPGATASASGKALSDNVVVFWEKVRSEDLGAVLAVQAGLESWPSARIETRYSPFWEPILQHFHKRIATGLAALPAKI
jgi:choline monooxygenase